MGAPLTELLPRPCPNACRALGLILGAARQEEYARSQPEPYRTRFQILAECKRACATVAAELIREPADG